MFRGPRDGDGAPAASLPGRDDRVPGDGVGTAGPRDPSRCARSPRPGSSRVGSRRSRHAPLASLAAATYGYSTTIDSRMTWLAPVRSRGRAPHTLVASDAKLSRQWQGLPGTVYLGRSQLGDGEELEVVGKLDGTSTAAALQLTGTVDGQAWSQRVVLNGATEGGYLPRLWAQRHLAARMLAKHEPVQLAACSGDSCPTEAEVRAERNEKIRQEVVALGKEYFLLSRHTSLIVSRTMRCTRSTTSRRRRRTWAPTPRRRRFRHDDVRADGRCHRRCRADALGRSSSSTTTPRWPTSSANSPPRCGFR